MLQPVCDNPQREGLHLGPSLSLGGPVGQDPWQLNDLADPAAVDLTLDLDPVPHVPCYL